MNQSLKIEISRLLSEGARPTAILRHILAQQEYADTSGIGFIRVLLDNFDIENDDAYRTRGWDRWNGKGLSDALLDRILDGKLRLKNEEGQKPELSADEKHSAS